jgi:hypothetical protein
VFVSHLHSPRPAHIGRHQQFCGEAVRLALHSICHIVVSFVQSRICVRSEPAHSRTVQNKVSEFVGRRETPPWQRIVHTDEGPSNPTGGEDEPSKYVGGIAQVVGRDAFAPEVFCHRATGQGWQLYVIQRCLGEVSAERHRPATAWVGRDSEAQSSHSICAG